MGGRASALKAKIQDRASHKEESVEHMQWPLRGLVPWPHRPPCAGDLVCHPRSKCPAQTFHCPLTSQAGGPGMFGYITHPGKAVMPQHLPRYKCSCRQHEPAPGRQGGQEAGRQGGLAPAAPTPEAWREQVEARVREGGEPASG